MRKGTIILEAILSLLIISMTTSLIYQILRISLAVNDKQFAMEYEWDMEDGMDIYWP